MKEFKERQLRWKEFKRMMKRDARIRLQNQKLRGQAQKLTRRELARRGLDISV